MGHGASVPTDNNELLDDHNPLKNTNKNKLTKNDQSWRKMKVVIRGLQNTGKSTLFNVLQNGPFFEQYFPSTKIDITTIQWCPPDMSVSDSISVELWDVIDVGEPKRIKLDSATRRKYPAAVLAQYEQDGYLVQPAEDATNIDVYGGVDCVVIMLDPFSPESYNYVVQCMNNLPCVMDVIICIVKRDIPDSNDMRDPDAVTRVISDRHITQITGGRVCAVEISLKNNYGISDLQNALKIPFLRARAAHYQKQADLDLEAAEKQAKSLQEEAQMSYDVYIRDYEEDQGSQKNPGLLDDFIGDSDADFKPRKTTQSQDTYDMIGEVDLPHKNRMGKFEENHDDMIIPEKKSKKTKKDKTKTTSSFNDYTYNNELSKPSKKTNDLLSNPISSTSQNVGLGSVNKKNTVKKGGLGGFYSESSEEEAVLSDMDELDELDFGNNSPTQAKPATNIFSSDFSAFKTNTSSPSSAFDAFNTTSSNMDGFFNASISKSKTPKVSGGFIDDDDDDIVPVKKSKKKKDKKNKVDDSIPTSPATKTQNQPLEPEMSSQELENHNSNDIWLNKINELVNEVDFDNLDMFDDGDEFDVDNQAADSPDTTVLDSIETDDHEDVADDAVTEAETPTENDNVVDTIDTSHIEMELEDGSLNDNDSKDSEVVETDHQTNETVHEQADDIIDCNIEEVSTEVNEEVDEEVIEEVLNDVAVEIDEAVQEVVEELAQEAVEEVEEEVEEGVEETVQEVVETIDEEIVEEVPEEEVDDNESVDSIEIEDPEDNGDSQAKRDDEDSEDEGHKNDGQNEEDSSNTDVTETPYSVEALSDTEHDSTHDNLEEHDSTHDNIEASSLEETNNHDCHEELSVPTSTFTPKIPTTSASFFDDDDELNSDDVIPVSTKPKSTSKPATSFFDDDVITPQPIKPKIQPTTFFIDDDNDDIILAKPKKEKKKKKKEIEPTPLADDDFDEGFKVDRNVSGFYD